MRRVRRVRRVRVTAERVRVSSGTAPLANMEGALLCALHLVPVLIHQVEADKKSFIVK